MPKNKKPTMTKDTARKVMNVRVVQSRVNVGHRYDTGQKGDGSAKMVRGITPRRRK